MKQYDVIVVGHMSVDLYFKGDNLTFEDERFQLALGGKYFSSEFHTGVGGGGANVAIGLTKLGLVAGLVVKLGKNVFSTIIDKKLEEVKLSKELCFEEPGYTNVSVILTRGRGERTIINFEQHNKSMVQKSEDYHRFTRARALYLGNLIDIKMEERAQILSHAKSQGVKTFVNLAGDDCKKGYKELAPLLSKTDVLIVNAHEFSLLVGTQYEELDPKKNVVQEYEFLHDKVVIVTDSKEGSYGYDKDNVYYQEAIEPKEVVDTTGAGDGYSAGFIASSITGGTLPTAMKKAAEYAAQKLTHLGAN